jgi:hypothetical protein
MKGLVSVKNCPVCQGNNREEAVTGGINSKTGLLYLQHASGRLGQTVEELLEKILVYQCNDCQSYWCDPWLDDLSSSQIFIKGSPDHIAAWLNFDRWLSRPDSNTTLIATASLYKILKERIGFIGSYAEYGCPFFGFLLLFRSVEINQSERINIFANSSIRSSDKRHNLAWRIYNNLSKLSLAATTAYHKLRLLLHGGNRISRDLKLEEVPKKKFFLPNQSTICWGANCVRYGNTCTYFASTVLNADTIFLKEKVDHAKFDLLGIFNILDHTNDPMKVITNGLRLANNIIIATHQSDTAGKQHLFAFHKSFPDYLSRALGDRFFVDDISNLVSKDNYNFIHIKKVQ